MVSKRTQQMTSFIVMDVLERACELESRGVDVVTWRWASLILTHPIALKMPAARH